MAGALVAIGVVFWAMHFVTSDSTIEPDPVAPGPSSGASERPTPAVGGPQPAEVDGAAVPLGLDAEPFQLTLTGAALAGANLWLPDGTSARVMLPGLRAGDTVTVEGLRGFVTAAGAGSCCARRVTLLFSPVASLFAESEVAVSLDPGDPSAGVLYPGGAWQHLVYPVGGWTVLVSASPGLPFTVEEPQLYHDLLTPRTNGSGFVWLDADLPLVLFGGTAVLSIDGRPDATVSVNGPLFVNCPAGARGADGPTMCLGEATASVRGFDGVGDTGGGPSVTVSRSVRTPLSVSDRVSALDGVVAITSGGSQSGWVIAADVSVGKILWASHVDSSGFLVGTHHPDRVVVATVEGNLVALDRGTGTIVWHRILGAGRSPPASFALGSGEVVVVQAGATRIEGLDSLDGAVRWSQEASGLTGFFVDDEVVVLSGGELHGKRVDPASGVVVG